MRLSLIGLSLGLWACSSAAMMSGGDGPGPTDGPPRSDGGGGDGPGPTACTPSCGARVCGDDGCGGACGACGPTELCSAAGACAPAPAGTALLIDPTAGPHPIREQIYGLAFADAATLTALRIPLDRWGGNGTTLYNWQLDVHNTGNDYFFENIADT